MGQKVLNKRSVQVVNNGPKLPTPEQLEYGELAINYADGHETLAIKNNQNEIVPFSCDETIYSNVQTQIDTTLVSVSSAITALSGSVSAFSASVISTYATSANTHSAIAAASGNVYKSATAYSNTVSGNIEKNFKKYATSANVHNTITAVGTRIDNLNTSLNELSGSVSAFSASIISTYATSADTHNAISTASGNVYKSATAYTKQVSGYIEQNFKKYPTSAQTHDTIAAVGTRVDNLNTSLMGLSGSVSAFSASVISTYATSAKTHNAISTASGNVYKSATAYTKQVSGYIEQNFKKYPSSAQTHNTIAAVGTRVDNLNTSLMGLSGSVSAFSASVISTYATSADTHNAIAAASGNVYKSATAYTKTVSGNIENNFKKYPSSAQTHGAVTALGTRIDNLNSTLNGLSGSVSAFSASVVSLEDDLIDRIESALTVVYKFKGTVTNYSDLSSITSPKNGDVYNVVNAQGTIGQAGYVPPGTNYAWVEDSGTEGQPGYVAAHWDALGGQIDLSNYVTQDQLSAATATTDNVMRAVYYVSGAVSAFSASVISKYATSANTHSAIAAASGNVYKSATAYTKTVSGNIEKNFEKYATSANTHNTFTAVGTRIDNLSSDLNTLSGAVSAFNASMIVQFATKAEASEYAAVALANSVNYTDSVSGNIEQNFKKYATSAQTHGAITALGTRIDNTNTAINGLSGSVSAFSASVISKYATSANTHSAIAAASGNVYISSTAYTKTVSGNIEKNFGKYATSANTHNTFTAVGTRIDNLSSDLNALSGAVSAFNATMIGDFATKAEASEYAAAALANAMDYTDSVSGNIEQNFGKYATSAQTHGAVTALGTRIDNVNTTINGLSGSVSAFSASVISKYATSANTHNAISTASGNVYKSSTAYTNTVSGNIEKNFNKYATSANVHSTFASVDNRIDNIINNYATSANTYNAISAVSVESKTAYRTLSEDTAGNFNVEIPGVTEYYDGLTVHIRLEKSYNGSRNFLNVNGLGYKMICYRRGSALTSHYTQYSELRLTYRTDGCGTGVTSTRAVGDIASGQTCIDGWVIENFYDSTETCSLRDYYSRYYVGPDRFSRYQFVGVNKDNQLVPFTVLSAGTNYVSTIRQVTAQKIRPQLLYYCNYGSNTASGNLMYGDYLYYAGVTANIRYTFNKDIPSRCVLYLRGTYDSSSDLFELYSENNTDFLVAVPSSGGLLNYSEYFVEGSDYIYFGNTYDYTNYAHIHPVHTVYRFDGANLVEYSCYKITNDLSVIDNISLSLNALSGSVSAFSASVISTYATSSNTHSAIAAASGNVYKSATAYTKQVSGYIESNFGKYATSANTHAKIESVKSELNNRIDGVSTDVSNLSGSVIAFSGVVRNNYSTKAEASQYAAAAYANAMNYTDSVSGNIEQNFKKYPTSAQTHGAITALGTRIDNVNTTINGLSGSVSAFSASVVSLEGDLIDRIESALTIVYKYKGTVTSISQLLSITNASNGDVYNLTVASGDTPPGTNYAWNETENTWDALGGSVDLSNYVTQDQLSAATATTDNVMRAVYYVSGAVSAFSASVISKYATSANTHSAIAAASGNVYNTATAYTKTVSGNIEKNFGKYATSANTHSTFTAVGTRIDNLSSDLNALSGAVSAFNASIIGDFATKAEASEYAAAALANSVSYTDSVSGNIELNFKKYATSAQTHGAITSLGTRIDNANTAINGLSGSVSAFSASVISKYATSANTHSAIAAASGNVYNTTTAYTKTVSGNIEQNFKKYATSAQTHGAITALGTRIDNANTAINGLSGSVSAFSAYVAYNYATKAEASEYASTAYSNATDYTDVVSGYIRTTLTGSYVTSAITHTAIKAVDTRVDGAIREIGYVSGGLYTFSASVVNKYATSANTHNSIAAASGNVYKSATAYTNTVSGNIEQNFKKYATSADTHNAISSTNTRIDNLTQEIIDNEFVTAHALNDLNDRLEDLFLNVVDLSTFADYFSFQQITEEDNGKILQVVNGKLTLVMPT